MLKKVLVIFGGNSNEHEVSLSSASFIISGIPSDKYEVVMLGITKNGRWLKYSGEAESLPGGNWLKDESKLTPAIISPDTTHGGLMVFTDKGVEIEKIDVVFPVLHGKNGEDGTMQGLCALAGLPFVGCDLLSSAMSMDKAVTNSVADQIGILQAKWTSVTEFEFLNNGNSFIEASIEKLKLPIFVKPANAGSSVGVSKAKTRSEVEQAIKDALMFDKKVVLEEAIDGIEVECSVLGNDEPEPSAVGEVVPCNEFYDYEAKYISDNSELHIPARLPEETTEKIREAAVKVFKAMGCSGMARIDFFVSKNGGEVVFNELNTIPGFTAISMYPKLFSQLGISDSELIGRLISLALEKWS